MKEQKGSSPPWYVINVLSHSQISSFNLEGGEVFTRFENFRRQESYPHHDL